MGFEPCRWRAAKRKIIVSFCLLGYANSSPRMKTFLLNYLMKIEGLKSKVPAKVPFIIHSDLVQGFVRTP